MIRQEISQNCTTSSGTWMGNKYNRKVYYIEEFSILAVEAVYVP